LPITPTLPEPYVLVFIIGHWMLDHNSVLKHWTPVTQ
jgi:hypothetical protein